ncbi:MAG: signal peptidase I, partial [Coprococcus sp.]
MSEEKSRSEALDEIFQDDPAKKAREKEIEKLTKKREKALAKAAAKKEKRRPEEEEEEQSEEDIDQLDDKALKKKIKKEKKKKEKEDPEDINIVKELIELAVYIAIVIGICWLVLTFVGQRTEVDGESMSDTLHTNDSLWIDKLSYRLHDPERYDIVVFPYDEEDDTYYIKRIIGLPGETVYIDEDGIVYINDEVLSTDVYGKEPIDPSKRGLAVEPITLGEDEYFVMGDNRNNSRDSRLSDVGNIKKDE